MLCAMNKDVYKVAWVDDCVLHLLTRCLTQGLRNTRAKQCRLIIVRVDKTVCNKEASVYLGKNANYIFFLNTLWYFFRLDVPT